MVKSDAKSPDVKSHAVESKETVGNSWTVLKVSFFYHKYHDGH